MSLASNSPLKFLFLFKGPFTRLLEWRGFAITTKFCYAFYLVQIPILQASIANTKDIRYYHATTMINLNEIFVIVVVSLAMTLLVETPFNNIKHLLFRRETCVDENCNIEAEREKTE
jgi:peptidoglycan/LPS O-acetylase OafA/YrhL